MVWIEMYAYLVDVSIFAHTEKLNTVSRLYGNDENGLLCDAGIFIVSPCKMIAEALRTLCPLIITPLVERSCDCTAYRGFSQMSSVYTWHEMRTPPVLVRTLYRLIG